MSNERVANAHNQAHQQVADGMVTMVDLFRMQQLAAFKTAHGLFKGNDVTAYLKKFNKALNHCRMGDLEWITAFADVVDEEAMAQFQLVEERSSWARYQDDLKQIFESRDSTRPTVAGFLQWVRQEKPSMSVQEVHADFSYRFAQLPAPDQRLAPDKVRLFVAAVCPEDRDKLLDDLLDGDNITTDWAKVGKVVKRRAVVAAAKHKLEPAPFPFRTAFLPRSGTVQSAQPATPGASSSNYSLEKEIERLGARFEEVVRVMSNNAMGTATQGQRPTGPAPSSQAANKSDYPRRCLFCDATDHTRVDCPSCVEDKVALGFNSIVLFK